MRLPAKKTKSMRAQVAGRLPTAVAGLALGFVFLFARPAEAATGQISKLSDVSFTAINPLAGASYAQSVCAYSTSLGFYSIKAMGSGASSAFTLSAGAGITLAYGVQWSTTAGAASGTAMTAGVALTNQYSNASNAGCTMGASTTDSLIITLAASDLQGAYAGLTYTGTLTLLLTPN